MGVFSDFKNRITGYIQASSLFKNLIVVNQIKVAPVQRISLDIQQFKTNLISAEGFGQQRKSLYDNYKNILDTTGHVSECIEKRIRHVSNRKLVLMHNGEEVEVVSKLTQKTFFKKALREVLNARMWGHSLLELDWGVDGNGVTALVDRRHVKPRFGIVAAQPFDMDGLQYREEPFSRSVIEIGEDEDLGKLLQCCIPAILLGANYSNWAEFAEIMGIPTRVGKYNSEPTRQILEEAFDKLGAAGWLVMPEDGQFEQHNPMNVGQNSSIFEALHRACKETISMALLSNTMTTNEASFGGYAQGKVHEGGEIEVFKDDRTYVVAFLNEKLNDYLRGIGFDIPAEAEWQYEEEENMTKKEKLELGQMLKNNNVPVGMPWWYETAGIPMPDESDLPEIKEEEE